MHPVPTGFWQPILSSLSKLSTNKSHISNAESSAWIVQKAALYLHSTLRVMTKFSVASLTQKVSLFTNKNYYHMIEILLVFKSLYTLALAGNGKVSKDGTKVKPGNYYIDGKSTTFAHL